jgi:hypothetical protein
MRIRKAVLSKCQRSSQKVHVNSWKTTYANTIPAEYLNNLNYWKKLNELVYGWNNSRRLL